MTMFCSSVDYPASPVPDRLVPELTWRRRRVAMLRWQASCIENPAVKPDQTFDALALMRRLRLAWRPEGSSGAGDLPRRLPGARIPRIRGGLGSRVTGGSAWAGLGRASTSAPRRRRAGG
jgi:hypothetical protein